MSAKTVSERVRRGRAEVAYSLIRNQLDWINSYLSMCGSALTKDEREDLREWFTVILEKIPAGKDPLS